MALRKCPGCGNIIAAETESCPICGCNPRTRRLRKFVLWGAAVATVGVVLQGQVRQRLPGFQTPAAVQAQPAIAP